MITDFTKDGKCSECGSCCSDCLPISKKEIKKIKRYIKKHNIKEQRHVFANIDMTCPFRNEKERKCEIYPVRPMICRQFMCNHTEEDIMKAKWAYHDKYAPVLMRKEFFENSEDEKKFMGMLAAIMESEDV